VIQFFRECLSEDDNRGSASRLMMLLHSLAGICWGTHVVIHTHDLPDPMKLAAVMTFVTAPYAVNKAHALVTAFAPNNGK
jgi:hypothetical protein